MLQKTTKELIIALLAGSLFGAGMLVSNMVNPQKIIAFLNVSGDWDPSLAFVMIGAIGVFSPIYHLFIKKRQQAIYGEPLTCIQHKNVDMHLIIGAVIFGIGWGLGGFCPGPAITSMANISPIIVIFIASLLLGSFLGRRYKKD